MIDQSLMRHALHETLERGLSRHPIIGILGPRQCGKTTLARTFVAPQSPNYFDLENHRHLQAIRDPLLALENLRGLVVIDEVQRLPELFPTLRVLADRPGNLAQFLILGSASPELLRQSSESLAGRIHYIQMGGFTLDELSDSAQSQHWLRGGFPRAYLAIDDAASDEWRADYNRTLVERDLPAMGVEFKPPLMARFWYMISAYHGQIWNAQRVAAALGMDVRTVGRYLDLLESAFLVRRLEPWHANISKRQIKAPKLYIRDSGLLHQLLSVVRTGDLARSSALGASYEGYALESLTRALPQYRHYFWGTHAGAELDLLCVRGERKLGFEIKHSDAPSLTKSMHSAMHDLALDQLIVIYPSGPRYRLAPKIEVMTLWDALGLGADLSANGAA